MRKKGFFILVCALVFSGWSISAQAIDMSLHGFFQGNCSADFGHSNPDGGGFKLAEERAQIKVDASQGPFHLLLKTDGWYDHVGHRFDSELREGYLDYTSGKWDARIGRQVITWGLGDLLFINDVFPKDYAAFFSGRPLEYLKKGIDGVKLGMYPGSASFELVVAPFFTPNSFPSSSRFWMYDPFSGITERVTEKPSVAPRNAEVALRAYRDLGGFDASIYLYRGFFRQPSAFPDNLFAPTNLKLMYPKLSEYGASLQGRAFDGVVSLEAGYYDSRENRKGTNPMLPNSQTRFLLGYQRQLWEDFTIGLQYYGEYLHDYSAYVSSLPPGFPASKQFRDLASVRLTQFFLHQTVRLSWFSFYGIADGDYLINPEVKYSFSDHLWAAVGANVFGGRNKTTQFGQLSKNDNIYSQLRYEF